MSMQDPFQSVEVWFLTGSQDLYGADVLAQVASQSQEVAGLLDAGAQVPVRVVWKPVLKDSESDPADDARGCGRRPVRRADRVDAHIFAREDVAARAVGAVKAAPAAPHAGEHSAAMSVIDMDFMNLNQSAHGDREFGYALTRMAVPRKVVVGHASDARVQKAVGMWARAAVGSAVLRSLRLARFGDNMRQVAVTEGDKTGAEIRFGVSVNT